MKFPSWPNPIGYRDISLGLNRVEELLSRLDNPHKKLPPTIHIAGTNGKGSTLAYLASVFSKSGYKFHRYISPHLVNFNERIVLDGKEIEDQFLNEIINECKIAAETPPKIEVTFFEGTTVAAFLAFSKIEADILLLETGMGGRLDATNVIDPVLTIITSISIDHTQFLGDSLEKIAYEKAGIIKHLVPVIIAKQKKEVLEVIKAVAKKNESPFLCFGESWMSYQDPEDENQIIFEFSGKRFYFPKPNLAGEYQIENVGNAIMSLLYLQNSEQILKYLNYPTTKKVQKKFEIYNYSVKKGITNTNWPARLQRVDSGSLFSRLPENYQLFLDGAHNEDGAKVLANWISNQNIKSIKNDKKRIPSYLICGMLEDKDTHDFLKYLSGSIDFVVGITIQNDPKSKNGITIARQAKEIGIRSAYAENFDQALDCIVVVNGKNNPGRVIISGSLHLAGQFLEQNTL